jgi:hypothetical protein
VQRVSEGNMELMVKEDSDFIVDLASMLCKTLNQRCLDEGILQVVCLGYCALPCPAVVLPGVAWGCEFRGQAHPARAHPRRHHPRPGIERVSAERIYSGWHQVRNSLE